MTPTDRPPLRDRYDGAVEAVPEELLTLSPPKTLHLPARGREGPACTVASKRDWRRIDTDTGLAFGAVLCSNCFELYLEHLARDPSAVVERVDSEAVAEIDAERFPKVESAALALADGGRPSIASKTDRVARVSGASTIYHAPTADGAVCGANVDTVEDRELLEPNYRPCKLCFDLDGEKK